MPGSLNVLVINPGSTSDEISYFERGKEKFHKAVRYSPSDLEPFDAKPITAQLDFRAKLLKNTLKEYNIKLKDLHAIVGRGGLLHPIPSGTYTVNDDIFQDLLESRYGEHASNLGGLLAHSLSIKAGIPAFIADPVVVDEMDPIARISGMVENPRISIFHALNQKEVARLTAKKLGKPYKECNFIVMHGGGGITVGAHKNGKVVDVNNGLDGEGPFTPQRSGTVPAGGFMRLIISDRYSPMELKLKLNGQGGLIALVGTSDLVLLEKFLDGEELTHKEHAAILPHVTKEDVHSCIRALSYQIAKEICSLTAVFNGKVDAVILTGGIVRDKRILAWIKERISWIAQIFIYPGSQEAQALFNAAARVLTGEEKAKIYKRDP